MKVKVKKSKPEKLTFPCLMYCEFGPVVLVTHKNEIGNMKGVVVAVLKKCKHTVGEYREDWVGGVFYLYNKQLVISN